MILEEGRLCRTISYVDSGALRAFYADKDGRESTIMFAMADWWVTDMFCFVNHRPAMMNIQAIEDSTIVQLGKDSFDELLIKVPKFERFFRILMQNAYTREQLRIIQRLSLPAEERYVNFLEKYPQVASQVAQKQIASYLGITPEFLSALRRKRKNSIS
ncbi:MAG TPA: Crp/Fnr family transcriptional regulator [Chitinophagaceae bacterium]|nr:Crp/Fnr family transcriptional regulator [Chitinophagaceae bacterium]